jgi:histidine triad (HIT) family protein
MDNQRPVGAKDFYCDEVLSGKTPVTPVYESANFLAFHHTRPAFATHIMLIPKIHVNDLTTLPEELVAELFRALQIVAGQVRDETGAARVISNLGDYQHNKHLHWHIISDPSLT